MSSMCSVCERPDSQERAEAVECSADGEVHALENALRQGGRQGGQKKTHFYSVLQIWDVYP